MHRALQEQRLGAVDPGRLREYDGTARIDQQKIPM
jgi:hypothetical protein